MRDLPRTRSQSEDLPVDRWLLELSGDSCRVVGTLVVDTNVEPEAHARSRRHWATVALEVGEETWFAVVRE